MDPNQIHIINIPRDNNFETVIGFNYVNMKIVLGQLHIKWPNMASLRVTSWKSSLLYSPSMVLREFSTPWLESKYESPFNVLHTRKLYTLIRSEGTEQDIFYGKSHTTLTAIRVQHSNVRRTHIAEKSTDIIIDCHKNEYNVLYKEK